MKRDFVEDVIDELDTNPPPLAAAEPKETPVLTADIEWAEPPAATRGRLGAERIDAIVAELQRNPGRWAAVDRKSRSSGGNSPYKRRGCETRIVVNDNPEGERRTWSVYARWPA